MVKKAGQNGETPFLDILSAQFVGRRRINATDQKYTCKQQYRGPSTCLTCLTMYITIFGNFFYTLKTK